MDKRKILLKSILVFLVVFILEYYIFNQLGISKLLESIILFFVIFCVMMFSKKE